ncbi:hypothetical protein [Amycolatopsis sp. cmx-4-54]|uniref:hypothetical protein n=1 Tax=Amycolatopsis sp. cmx-4-54 TaxID=2790936 RepID=UPI0039793101
MTTTQDMKNPRRAGTNQAAGVQGNDYPEGQPMTTAYVPSGTERADLAAILARRGVRLELADDFEPRECNWNGLETCGPVIFRIHRAPAANSGYPADDVEVGLCCFTDALNVAQSEQDPNSNADLIVERRIGA